MDRPEHTPTAWQCIPPTPVFLLSNGCSATGPFAVKEGKMFMLGIASLIIFVPLFFLFLFLCLSPSCLKTYPFTELKCTEEHFYLVRVVRDINVHNFYTVHRVRWCHASHAWQMNVIILLFV